MKGLVEFLVREGTQNTVSGGYNFHYATIASETGVSFDRVAESIDDILTELEARPEVMTACEESYHAIFVTFYRKFCSKCMEDLP